MKLSNIISKSDVIIGQSDIEVSGITFTSKNVKKGYIFVCLNGIKQNGEAYIDEAIEKGAVAIVCERQVKAKVTQIIVKSARIALSKMSSKFYGNPAKKLKLVGITGTNGKTTSSFIIKDILEEFGNKVGIIGTNGIFVGEKFYQSQMTTPDPPEFYAILKNMVDAGVNYVVMEASAHAIKLDKLYGIKFDVGIITNITEDHLDFFKTMDEYEKTKLNFLNSCKLTAVNIDDERIRKNLKNIKVPFITFGLYSPAECFAVDIKQRIEGTKFVVNILDDVYLINTKLVGEFNVYNILGAISACTLIGYQGERIIQGIQKINPPMGRFNCFKINDKIDVIIDYAHTPDGMENVLKTIKSVSNKKLICVFGCGGDRDSLKRPIMGKIAEKYSDFVIVTSDNPRFEKPEEIVLQIQSGMQKENHMCIISRPDAIKKAIEICSDGGIIALLGKGGENYQEINGQKIPYNDFREVEKSI